MILLLRFTLLIVPNFLIVHAFYGLIGLKFLFLTNFLGPIIALIEQIIGDPFYGHLLFDKIPN